MAELIGTAEIRVDMDASRARRALRRLARDANRQLADVQQEITQTGNSLRGLGGASIAATVDDQTGPGVAAVRQAVASLRDLSPIRIDARFSGLERQAAAAAAALQLVENASGSASRALRKLGRRATEASAALAELRTVSTGVGRSLRTLDGRLTTAHTRMGELGERTRTLRDDMDEFGGRVDRVVSGLSGLRSGLGNLPSVTERSSGGMERLKRAALALTPVLIPITAAAAPIAASLAAAGVAMGAFGLAIGKQVSALVEAAEAETKYRDAVREHGRHSEEAAKADIEFAKAAARMPKPTREAAAALTVMKQRYTEWSDSLADDTMPVATRSFAAFGALFPKLTPLVQGTSRELKRLVTVAAGGIQSAGFERFMARFSEFASGVLRRATDGLVHFSRVMAGGAGRSQFAEFLAYVRSVGPAVAETLGNLARALVHLLASASDLGVSMLSVVNAVARLVNAIPGDAIATFLQLALAFKAVTLAAAGMAAVSGLVGRVSTQLIAANTAAGAASGGLASLTAAFGALSRGAKVALIGTGIGILVVALSALSEMGKKAPPDVDKLTTSLRSLGSAGKVSGEAARSFGKDLSGLADSLQKVVDPKGLDQFQQSLVSFFGTDSTPVKEAKENIDALDKSLANLVKNGQTDLASAALESITERMKGQGFSAEEVRSQLDDYKSALADMALEQKLTADAMGLFGEQAISTQQKLDAQKLSADGLRQSIQALNDVNQQGLGGMIAFEAAIDAAAKASRDNAGALSMTGGRLDLNSAKAQSAATALNDLAAKTDQATAAARESGASWSTVNGIYDRGRTKLIESAQAMGLTREEAKKLASQILKTPDKTARLKGNLDDLKKKVGQAKREIKSVPPSKTSELKGKLNDLQKKVREAKGQLKSVPSSKRSELRATIADLQAKVRQAKADLDSVRSKHVSITVGYRRADGQTFLGPSGRFASGGLVQGFPHGGAVSGPGTATSDSIPSLLSDGEFVMRAAAVRRYGVDFFDRLNRGRMARMASGGAGGFGASSHGMGRDMIQGLIDGLMSMAGSLSSAVSGLAEAAVGTTKKTLGISSPSRVFAQIGKDTGRGFIKGLTGTKRQIDQTADRVARSITRAFRGTGSRLDNRLVDRIQRTNRRLQRLAEERDRIAKRIADARKFAADATAQARATGSLGALVQRDFFAPRLIAGGMQKAINDIKAFTRTVRTLQKRGLNRELLRQILQMGPQAGLQFAKSLAGQNQSTIRQFNRLQRQLDKEAKKLGKTGADLLFDSGKKAGQGFLAGLKAQQKAIEKLMLDIAKGMKKAIRKALGIKSPSRVMAEVGQLSGLGLAGGLAGSVPVVDRAMSRLAGAVAGGVPSRLSAIAAPAAAALPVGAMRTGNGTPANVTIVNHFHLDNHGVIGSPRELDDWLVRRLDRLRLQKRLPAGA